MVTENSKIRFGFFSINLKKLKNEIILQRSLIFVKQLNGKPRAYFCRFISGLKIKRRTNNNFTDSASLFWRRLFSLNNPLKKAILTISLPAQQQYAFTSEHSDIFCGLLRHRQSEQNIGKNTNCLSRLAVSIYSHCVERKKLTPGL